MHQQNIWHIAKYQDNKNHRKFVQTACGECMITLSLPLSFIARLFSSMIERCPQ